MPDLGFADDDAIPDFAPLDARQALVVSLRGDRPPLDSACIEGLRKLAQSHCLEITAATQVFRDEPHTTELATALQCAAVGWGGRDHDDHETRLRSLYRRAWVVVSDRLHVLIAACTHGAVPVGISTDREDKIRRQFSAAAIPLVVTDMSSVEKIRPVLMNAEARVREMWTALSRTREELTMVRARVSAMLSTTTASSIEAVRS
jgi:hypothetical protein